MNIIIIGATSGIGKAIFEFYATKDNLIAIVGRRSHLLEQLRQKYPTHTITAKADITNLSETEKTLDYLCHDMPKIDLAIVCSGTGDINKSLDYSKECPTIETNITGWTFLMDQLYHRLEKQGNGHLVAISSAGGLRGEPNAPHTAHPKLIKLIIWRLCAKELSRMADISLLPMSDPGLLTLQWQKVRDCFG